MQTFIKLNKVYMKHILIFKLEVFLVILNIFCMFLLLTIKTILKNCYSTIIKQKYIKHVTKLKLTNQLLSLNCL